MITPDQSMGRLLPVHFLCLKYTNKIYEINSYYLNREALAMAMVIVEISMISQKKLDSI